MNEALISKLLEVSGDFVKQLGTMAPAIMSELVNYFIFLAGMSIVRNPFLMLVVVGFYRFFTNEIQSLKSLLDDQKGSSEVESTINSYKLLRFLGATMFSCFLMYNTFQHLEIIGKATIAPRIFMIEQANSFVKPNEGANND